MNNLVLSIFPGIDLLGRAFEEIGYCVVRGPDVLWGGDIRAFHPPAGIWGGAIGGPPCQAFSSLRHMVEHNGYKVAENLIPEFERVVGEAQPEWFLMENVRAAPLPQVDGYQVTSLLFNNRWTGAVQHRERRFSFGTRDGRELKPEISALEATEWAPAVLASGGRPVQIKPGGNGEVKRSAMRNFGHKTSTYLVEGIRLQGLPDDFLADAPFTVAGKIKVIGNGVPMETGRAMARAVRQLMESNGRRKT
ncbi:MAG: DNA cytosine methyltransferase [Chloroflexota bacterium]